MPIGYTHAFGDGLVLPRPRLTKRILWRAMSPLSRRAQLRDQIARAWRQFERSAQASDETLLGAAAWCVNGSGNRKRIILAGHVVCRGLLRVERFGAGKITIHPEVYIGDDTLISCAESVTIGSYTLIAHGVHIFDNNTHPADWRERRDDWLSISGRAQGPKPQIATAPIWIGASVWIGFNSVIMKGVRIGDRSVIAAGSVVTENVPPDSLVAGNPGRVVRSVRPEDKRPA